MGSQGFETGATSARESWSRDMRCWSGARQQSRNPIWGRGGGRSCPLPLFASHWALGMQVPCVSWVNSANTLEHSDMCACISAWMGETSQRWSSGCGSTVAKHGCFLHPVDPPPPLVFPLLCREEVELAVASAARSCCGIGRVSRAPQG